MQTTTEQVLQTALTLPPEERFQLIEALIAADQAPAPPFDDSWRDVIQRRSAEIDSGAVQAVPWPEVRHWIHKKFV